MNILFICRGNVLRSIVASSYLNSLQLKHVTADSCGIVADSHRVSDKPFFLSTLRLLDKHGLAAYAKSRQEQLTGQLMENRDLVICMNQIVIDEAAKIVALPKDTINWDIVDIGEGHRIDREHNRHVYEEDIYQEIVARVDELVCDYHLA